jgi:hypothetical protein
MKNVRKLTDKFQKNFSLPGTIDARVWYRVETRRLRNTGLYD